MPKTVSYHVPREAALSLAEIRHRSRHQNDTDVVRVAIHGYDNLLRLTACNSRIYMVDNTGGMHLFSPHLKYERAKQQDVPANVRRSAVFLGEEIPALVADIRQRTRVTSISDVIRSAVVIMDELTAAIARGERLVVKHDDGTSICYDPFAPPVLSRPIYPAPTRQPRQPLRARQRWGQAVP